MKNVLHLSDDDIERMAKEIKGEDPDDEGDSDERDDERIDSAGA